MSGYRIAGAACQGSAHIRHQIPCQDVVSGWTDGSGGVIVLADGAGSCQYALEGARAAVAAAKEVLRPWCSAEQELTEAELKNAVVSACVAALRASPHPLEEQSCTLLFAAARKDGTYWCGHIGDGYAFLAEQVESGGFSVNGAAADPAFLGKLYYRLGQSHQGMKHDPEKAFQCYRKAAEDYQNLHACYALYECYANGTGTEADEEKAFSCLERCAAEGDTELLAKVMGILYQSGKRRIQTIALAQEILCRGDNRRASTSAYLYLHGLNAPDHLGNPVTPDFLGSLAVSGDVLDLDVLTAQGSTGMLDHLMRLVCQTGRTQQAIAFAQEILRRGDNRRASTSAYLYLHGLNAPDHLGNQVTLDFLESLAASGDVLDFVVLTAQGSTGTLDYLMRLVYQRGRTQQAIAFAQEILRRGDNRRASTSAYLYLHGLNAPDHLGNQVTLEYLGTLAGSGDVVACDALAWYYGSSAELREKPEIARWICEAYEFIAKNAPEILEFERQKNWANARTVVRQQEQLEQERLARERAEQERLALERAEQERLAREREEQERLALERAEQERLALERAEQERLALERAEQERLAQEREEQERLALERAEQERLARERRDLQGMIFALVCALLIFGGLIGTLIAGEKQINYVTKAGFVLFFLGFGLVWLRDKSGR